MSTFIQVACLSDFDNTSTHVIEMYGQSIVLFFIRRQIYAVDNYCPHAGYRLDDGVIDGTTVICLLHGAEFDLATGRCTGGLPCDDIVSYETRIDSDGGVWLRSE